MTSNERHAERLLNRQLYSTALCMVGELDTESRRVVDQVGRAAQDLADLLGAKSVEVTLCDRPSDAIACYSVSIHGMYFASLKRLSEPDQVSGRRSTRQDLPWAVLGQPELGAFATPAHALAANLTSPVGNTWLRGFREVRPECSKPRDRSLIVAGLCVVVLTILTCGLVAVNPNI